MSISTKTRGRQAKPTRHEVNAAWDRLRATANAGDLQASALLIALADRRPLISITESIAA